jgi:hypothetical protein
MNITFEQFRKICKYFHSGQCEDKIVQGIDKIKCVSKECPLLKKEKDDEKVIAGRK